MRRPLVAAVCLGAIVFSPASADEGSAPAPGVPAGRPPRGALSRREGRIYDIEFNATIYAAGTVKGVADPLVLAQNSIEIPLTMLDTFSQVDPASIRAGLSINNHPVPGASVQIGELRRGVSAVKVESGAVTCQNIAAQFAWRAASWSSVLDEAVAARTAWPQSWPDDAQPWLDPQPWIESDQQIFGDFVQRTAQGNLHGVSVHIAAKELVKATLLNVRAVRSTGVIYDATRVIRGLDIRGAKRMAETGEGTSHDLACLCVAVLRAAGIPSRINVGIIDPDRHAPYFVTWAEYYLPDSGWVPFLPDDLRGKATSLDSSLAWKNFGTVKDLNLVVPVSHWILPEGVPAAPVELPALWGWRSAGAIQPCTMREYTRLQMTSQGRVPE